MNMKYYLILVLAVVIGISSCYDDKGNYDYKNLKKIEIESFSDGTIYKTLRDTLRINPKFIYSTPDTVMNLEYTWTYIGKVIGRERNLEYVIDTMAKGYCSLKVEDKDNGVFFTQGVYLQISNKYQTDGYVVLGEKDGKSKVSFLPLSLVYTDNILTGASCTIVEDVYQLENKEELGRGPIKMHKHYCAVGNDLNDNQMMVVQEEAQQLVDLNSKTFLKEVTGDQVFAGGWPAGLKVTDVMFMRWCDLIRDEQGQLYSRIKSTDQLFHSEYFLPEPLKYEGQVMKNMHIIPGKIEPSKLCLLYDGSNQRFLAFMDVNSDAEQARGKVVALTEAMTENGEYPAEFVPLENFGDYRFVFAGYVNPDYYTHIEYFVVLEKDGKFYQQEFLLERDFSTSELVIMNMKFREIPGGESVIDGNTVFYVLPSENNGEYVLMATGNRLYLYDRAAPENGIKLFYTFDGNITSMDSEIFRSTCLGVGLDNGRFAIMKMINAKNLQTDKEKLFWITPEGIDLGNIKSVCYK